MHGLEIFVRTARGKRHEFMQAFNFFSSKSHFVKACKYKKLFEAVDEDGLFLWIELWTEKAALDEHMASDRFQTLKGAIDVLGELENLKIVEMKTISK